MPIIRKRYRWPYHGVSEVLDKSLMNDTIFCKDEQIKDCLEERNSMVAIDLDKVKAQVEIIIRRAGEIFIDTVIEKRDIEEKGFANYVTIVDYKVQEFLMKELLKVTSNCNIIAEESDKNSYKLEGITWIIDPVDGTTNLMYDYGHSAISVGLFVDGEAALGFIYNPSRDEFFLHRRKRGLF
jgi:Archaeal fructose-1,6-bisphosphatase and related enzymes of inositol monophosphatase family